MYEETNREAKRETKTDGIKTSGPAKNNVDQDDFHGSAATTYQFDERRRLGGRDAEKHLRLLQRPAGAVVGSGSTRGRLTGVAGKSAR
jgi:hypothetical protein